MNQPIKIALPLLAAACFLFPRSDNLRAASAQSLKEISSPVAEQSGEQDAPADIGDKLKAMAQYLEKACSELGFSGVVLVAKGDKIVLHQSCGWADQEKTSKIKLDTKFCIASITKQFTAAAILKLQEQGLLNVNDTIGKFFKNIPGDKTKITLHQLLTHTSGLAQNYAADGILDRDDAIKTILEKPLKNPPGERFGYSNDGYNLLAAIVEIVSGKPYEAFLRQNLLTPAGMEQTCFWGEPQLKEPLAAAYMQKKLPDDIKQPNWGFRGATGMFSTAADLVKWYRALLTDKVLNKNSTGKLFSPYAPTSAGDYTYGWFISKSKNGGDVLWTAGSEDFGHNGIIKAYTDGTLIIVVTNSGDISGVPARSIVSAELERILFPEDMNPANPASAEKKQ